MVEKKKTNENNNNNKIQNKKTPRTKLPECMVSQNHLGSIIERHLM